MKRWSLLTVLTLFVSGCSQKSPKQSLPKSHGPENLMFLKDLHSQFPSHFSLPILLHFVKQGKLTEAGNYVNKALQISPDCAALHIAQGFIWEAKSLCGEPSAAKMATVAYQAALTADPSKPAAHYLLGQQALAQGDAFVAQRHFAQTVIMRPNEPKFLYVLACASYRNGDIKTAYCSMKKALALDPKNPLYQRTAAIIFAAAGKFQETKVALEGYRQFLGQKNKGDLKYVSQRIDYWKGIHENPKVSLMVRPEDEEDKDQKEEKKEDLPSVILDGYILLVSQGDTTQKGNNVFNAYDQVKSVLNPLSLVLGGSSSNTAGNKPLFWWGKSSKSVGGKINADGKLTGHTFNYNITPVSLNYALNIANASYSVATYSSRPTISTLLGKPASFFGGIMIQTAPSGGSLITIDAGDKLEVTPKEIAEDGLITLDISMTSADPVGQGSSNVLSQNALGQGLSNQLVQVNSSVISTIVKAYPGQTIVVGGLKTVTRKVTDTRFPLLGSIPIVQYFFSSVQNQLTEATIMYLLTVRLGGQSQRAYAQKPNTNEVFNQLHEVDPQGFSFCGTPTLGLILKHLAKTSLFSDFQSGDVTVIPDVHKDSLLNRLEQLTSFLYF